MTDTIVTRRTMLGAAATVPLLVSAGASAATAAAPLRVIAEIVAKPEHADAIRGALVPFAASTRKEPDCLSYALYDDQQIAGRFYTYESWADEVALTAHLTSPAMQAAGKQLGALLVSPPVISKLKPL